MYHTNIPSPYMVDRFNRIVERGNLDFQAMFHERRFPDRSWDVRESDWQFPYRYLGPGRAKLLVEPVQHIRRVRPDVLVSLYENMPFLLGMAAARSVDAKVIIHVMKVFDTWRPRRTSREMAKRFIFPRVDAIHVPGQDAAEYAKKYGARESQFAMFAEPVDVQHFAAGSKRGEATSKERERLGLSGCVFISVGMLIRRKGLDHLFDAYERLCATGADVSLLLVGDGADEQRYRNRAIRLPRVVFAGFVQQPDLPAWYGLADAFVFPTLGDPYGYVVEEAMASSLPVVTTESAGEIRERVVDGVTGFIVPPADSVALLEKMILLAGNAELRAEMGYRGFERVQPRTIDWWAREFEQMTERVLTRERSDLLTSTQG